MKNDPANSLTKAQTKILFDLSFLFDQYSRRGIGIYGRNVLSRLFKYILEEEPSYEIKLIGFNSLSENLIELGYSQFTIEEISNKLEFYSLGESRHSGIKNLREWNKRYLPALEALKPDIFYAVHFERGLPTVPRLAGKLTFHPKTVVIAHDAIPLITNKFSAQGFIQNLIKKKFYLGMWKGVQNADLVITASEFSKQDIIKYGKVDANKIEVVYLGVDEKFNKENYSLNEESEKHILEAYSVENKNYFFYDTGVEANKGSSHLLKVFKEILELNSPKLPNYLVIIGKDFFKGEGLSIKPKSILGDDFIKAAKKIGVAQNLITTDKISDEHLVTLLFNSKVYLNLSTYEGFGLGIAQAMAAGIPAIAANASCIPEIAKNGAYLIDVSDNMDYKATANKIKKYLQNTDKVNETIKQGRKVARKYDWDKTVEETFKLLNRLTV